MSKTTSSSTSNPIGSREPIVLFTVQVTPLRLVATCIGACIALGWVFLLGMIGERVTTDDTGIIMNMPVVYATGGDGTGTDPNPAAIIQPEDLTYPGRVRTPAVLSAPGSNRPATVRPAAIQPATGTRPATAQVPLSTQPQTAIATPLPSGTTQPKPGTPQYAFVYQVASFKDVKQAEILQGKLQASGLTVRLQEALAQGAIWNRVVVDFTGGEGDIKSLRDILKTHKIERIIMLSKRQL